MVRERGTSDPVPCEPQALRRLAKRGLQPPPTGPDHTQPRGPADRDRAKQGAERADRRRHFPAPAGEVRGRRFLARRTGAAVRWMAVMTRAALNAMRACPRWRGRRNPTYGTRTAPSPLTRGARFIGAGERPLAADGTGRLEPSCAIHRSEAKFSAARVDSGEHAGVESLARLHSDGKMSAARRAGRRKGVPASSLRQERDHGERCPQPDAQHRATRSSGRSGAAQMCQIG